MRTPESFVQQPIRSLQTMLRVLSELDDKLPVIIPDGIYGPSTANFITVFQRLRGLPVSGVTDQTTWELIVSEYESALVLLDQAEPIQIHLDPNQRIKYGDVSPYVYLVQGMLTQLASDHFSISQPGYTGVMDQQTVNALKDFQKLADLEVTGELDKITWKNLVLHYSLNAHHNTTIIRNE